jgi:hypothetical protein
MTSKLLPLHEESSALICAPIDKVFNLLDDPMALSAHMGKSSMMMMGSRMTVQVDAGDGRVLKSKISMYGNFLGLPISLEEVVIERRAPFTKVWETIGTPQLLIMAHYRMGFELTPKGDSSLIRIFIDYSLPTTAPSSYFGYFFGGLYARWCIRKMTEEAIMHFNLAAST